MTDVLTTTNHYLDEYNRAYPLLTGSDLAWLNALRKKSLQQFLQQGFPTPADEEWKYTNVTPLSKRSFSLAQPTTANISLDTLIEKLPQDMDCIRLVLINGHFAAPLSNLANLSGVTIQPLAQAIKEKPDLVQPYLEKIGNATAHAFIPLNIAFLNGGVLIHIKANTHLTKPIQLIFVTENTVDNRFIPLYNLVIAETNSRCTLIENYISLQEQTCFTNTISQLYLAENSEVTHYKLLQENQQSFYIGTICAYQEKNSRFSAYHFTLGGKLVRSDTEVQLLAEYAECALNGLYLARGSQHIDHHTLIDHIKPHGKSRENYKGILMQRAHGVFNGKIIVRPDAQKTQTYQSNKNLLLSNDAEIDAKPQLEIFADDVQCTHGATVGQLNADALFYLRSRGIDENSARNTLVAAFAREIVETVSLLPLRKYLHQTLNQHLASELHDKNTYE